MKILWPLALGVLLSSTVRVYGWKFLEVASMSEHESVEAAGDFLTQLVSGTAFFINGPFLLMLLLSPPGKKPRAHAAINKEK